MKTNILLTIAWMMVSGFTAWSQPKPYMGVNPAKTERIVRYDGPVFEQQLDDKQREAIRKIRLEQVKDGTQAHNLLKEKRARLEVLQTADKPDMKEINKTIDEISAIQAQKMKAQAANRQKIRSLLTEEQRILFDAQREQRNEMRKKHMERRFVHKDSVSPGPVHQGE